MVNNFFLSSCAKLGWGHHFFLLFFWHFFPFKDPKNAVPFVERISFEKNSSGHQNIAGSLNCFLLPSLTCNFSRFEEKKLVIIGD
jgi:hypothetical protein